MWKDVFMIVLSVINIGVSILFIDLIILEIKNRK